MVIIAMEERYGQLKGKSTACDANLFSPLSFPLLCLRGELGQKDSQRENWRTKATEEDLDVAVIEAHGCHIHLKWIFCISFYFAGRAMV